MSSDVQVILDYDKAVELARRLRKLYLDMGYTDKEFWMKAAEDLDRQYVISYWNGIFIRYVYPPSVKLIEYICDVAEVDATMYVNMKQKAYATKRQWHERNNNSKV